MLLLMAMLLMACGGSEEENGSIPEDEDCYLDIYVYAPDRPIVTRGDVGEIKVRTEAESNVHTLQIWVFKSSNGDPVGYLNAGADGVSEPYLLNENGQQVYRMKVAKDFANNPEAVDVYVVANAASYTSTTLNGSTTRTQLNDAMIGSGSFGTSTLVTSVPTTGLPMSAVLKNQHISGKFPTLRIGTESQIATLHLTRAVSKLRFVLCRITEEQDSKKKLDKINDISLDANQIPTQTYLIPREIYTYTYGHDPISYGKVEKADILEVADPLVYAYETQAAQAYEDMINQAIADEKLKELGLTYFRESDKQLTGTITYTYNENNSATNTQETVTETVPFSMVAAGDFLRNHSWIIYIYYLDSKIYVLTVTHIGMRSWNDGGDATHTIYNW